MAAQSPEDMVRVWSDAFNRADLDALLNCYEEGGTLTRRSEPPITGHPAIRALFSSMLAGSPTIEVSTRKIVRGGDLALCYHDWTLRAKNPDGTPMTVSGKSVEVLRRQPDATWKYILDDPFGGV